MIAKIPKKGDLCHENTIIQKEFRSFRALVERDTVEKVTELDTEFERELQPPRLRECNVYSVFCTIWSQPC
jgi:hypothetical protein